MVDELKKRGIRVGGIVTLEIRKAGTRTGFKIIDIESGREAPLATASTAPGPRVGKYLVHVENMDTMAVEAISKALEQGDVIVIDEIGPMELKSQKFINTVEKVLASEKPLLATIHYRLKHPLLDHIRSRRDAEIIEVTERNRDTLPAQITEKIMASLLK